MNKPMTISVTPDLTEINNQTDECNYLLERLPDGIRNSFAERLANLLDFGLETETLPAAATGSYVLRFRSVALADFCVAARGALNSCSASIGCTHGEVL